MSNTNRPKMYGETAAYARKEASLGKKLPVLQQKRNLARMKFEADPTNMKLRDNYILADIAVKNHLYVCEVHYRRYSEYL